MKIDWQIYFSISVLQFVKNVIKLKLKKQKIQKKIAEIIFHFMYYYIFYFYPNVETKVRRVCIVVSKVHRWNYSKIRAAPEKSDYDR